MKRVLLVALAVLGIVNVAAAEDLTDPTGAWQWRFPNQSAVHTLKLKLERGKLSGSIQNYSGGPESPIEDGTFEDGVVSFRHSYLGRGNEAKSVASYKGMVGGETIKGTIEFKHPNRALSRDWYAERKK
jgi:hypothetical protein